MEGTGKNRWRTAVVKGRDIIPVIVGRLQTVVSFVVSNKPFGFNY